MPQAANSARAVTQWAMIDLQSRSAIDLSWVGDAHADAIGRCRAPRTDKPRKIRCGKPYRDGRTPRGLQRTRLQPPRQHDALYRNDVDMLPVDMLTQEAPVRLDIHFLKECRFGQDADGGVRVARAFGAV